jgi:uncharacterized membrane protein
MDDIKTEYKKGYEALVIMTILGYICCGIYAVITIIAMFNIIDPILGIIALVGVALAVVGIYVFARIGFAAFIVRDSVIEKSEKSV